MRFTRSIRHGILIVILSSFLFAIGLRAQAQKPPAGSGPPQAGQTIRVKVGLVQTDVMVLQVQAQHPPGEMEIYRRARTTCRKKAAPGNTVETRCLKSRNVIVPSERGLQRVSNGCTTAS